MSDARENKENTLLSLALNIFLPVLILQKLGPRLGPQGPLYALLLGLSLPIGYGIYIFARQRRFSWVAGIGLISVLASGIFAVFNLTGRWFVLKEGLLPLILGAGVLATSWSKKPFFKAMFFQPQLIDTQKISAHIEASGQQTQLEQLFRQTTWLFSCSFLLSSLLNFWLASQIFTQVDGGLDEATRQQLVNGQIAQMTWQSQLVIVLPLMVFSVVVLLYFLRRLSQMTGLKLDELFINK